MSETNCAYCSGTLPPSDGPGRPPRYCCSGCRRAAQLERQRVCTQLAALETEGMTLRHLVARGVTIHDAAFLLLPAERLADVETDIKTMRLRLRDLLDE